MKSVFFWCKNYYLSTKNGYFCYYSCHSLIKMWKSVNKMEWKNNKPVVMILNGTDSISSDLKLITFSIHHLSPPQVIGKYKIYFSFCLCFIQLLFNTRSAWEVVVSVISLTTVCYLCSERFWQPPEFLCYYKYTKKPFGFQNTIDCCRFDCIVSINSFQKAWYGDDDRFCLSVHALVKWANKKEHREFILNLICCFHNLNIIYM